MELGGAPPSKKNWGGFGVLPCGDAVGCVCGGDMWGQGHPGHQGSLVVGGGWILGWERGSLGFICMHGRGLRAWFA